MLDNLQIFLGTFFSGISFLLILEAFGFLTLRLLKKICSKAFPSYKVTDFSSEISWVVHVFVGLLTYAMTLFSIGILGLLSKGLVLGFSFFAFAGISLVFRRLPNLRETKKHFFNNWPIYFGTTLFLAVASISTFRPTTQFDALWYHFETPKQFLYRGNIDHLGDHLRYSVHPFINFFWALFPLSFPFPLAVNTIIYSWFQTFLIALSLFYASWFGKKHLAFSALAQFLTPVLMGITTYSIFWMGAGYNDIFAFPLTLVGVLFYMNESLSKKLNIYSLSVAILIVMTMGLLKIFFLLFACIVFLFIALHALEKHGKSFSLIQIPSVLKLNKKHKNFSSQFVTIASPFFVIFIIFLVPWLIRSYLNTGKILYPVGAEWLQEQTYSFAGSVTSKVHWGEFVWNRLEENLFSILFTSLSPVFALGFLSIINKKIRSKLGDVWYLATFGFILLTMVAVVFDLRYIFGAISLIMFLGVYLLSSIYNAGSYFVKSIIFVLPLLFLPLSYNLAVEIDDFENKVFINKGVSIDTFLSERLIGNPKAYYPSFNSPKPEDYSEDKKIFAINIHNRAYIPNDTIDFRSEEINLEKLSNADEFHQYMIDKNVDYLLVKSQRISAVCDYFNYENSDECDLQIYFSNILYDPAQSTYWYKVNQ